MIETMLLAAGLSTRLYPLTKNIPKPLLPFLNRQILDYTLAYLNHFGITRASTNLHHGKDAFLKKIDDLRDFELKPYLEQAILGTGGGIQNMQSYVSGENFLVINCDFMTDIDLKEAFDFHKSQNALATLVLIQHPEQDKYGTVNLNDKNNVLNFSKLKSSTQKPSQYGMFTGIHFLNRKIFEYFPRKNIFCIVQDVYQKLLDQNIPLHGYLAQGTWLDVGEIHYYSGTQFKLLKKPFSWMSSTLQSENLPQSIKATGSTLLGKDITFHESVQLIENNIIGSEVVLGKNVTLKNTIVFPNTNISDHSNYDQMILTPEYQIKV